MPSQFDNKNQRILVIDDNPNIHDDYRNILLSDQREPESDDLFGNLLADSLSSDAPSAFTVDAVFQGKDGLALVTEKLADHKPYAVAFVDMRMPPGWDGLETVERIWKVDPDLQVVICTAYSDYAWSDISKKLGNTDNLLILKKPFDFIEVYQLATALTEKWHLARQVRATINTLEDTVEARTSELRDVISGLKESEQRLQDVALSSADWIWETDRAGQLTFAAGYVKEITGYEPDDIINKRLIDFFDPNAEDIKSLFLESFSKKKPLVDLETWIHTGDDRRIYVQTSGVPVVNGSGTLKGFRGVAKDITERHQLALEKTKLEEHLQHSQKMDAIGRLAGGVAHDMNNILAGIMGLASLFKSEMDPTDQNAKDIEDILFACARGRDLTRNLLGFARKGKYKKGKIKLNDVVHETADLLKRTISKKIEIKITLERDLSPIEGDRNQIFNALMNVCINAVDAMKDQGILTISTRNVVKGDHRPSQVEGVTLGSCAQVRIKDTGTGMDQKTMERVFEPFFTTKPQGEGTGLGLSMVYGVISNHGGTVTIDSNIGQGTTVTIEIPAFETRQTPTSMMPPAYAEPMLIGEGTILLVDDEELVRAATERLLKKLGYRVLLASDGKVCVQEYKERKDDISLVILDLMMPTMDGEETYRELQKIDPNVRVLLTSGFSKSDKANRMLNAGALGFIEKPFEMNDLVAKIREIS
ncbi:MAG: response regulator [Myxococcota bacterium]|nr:response regulator [Myxococcota bacterium]